MEGGFQEKSVDWPSCEYSRRKGPLAVAARKVVVLREQNPDLGLVAQPSLSHYAKKLITARLSPPFSAPLKCTLNDGANPYRMLTERSHTLRVIDWTFFSLSLSL